MSTVGVWSLMRSVLLWGLLLVIIVYSTTRFVRQHNDILALLRKLRVPNWLNLVWQWLRRSADKTRGNLSRVIRDSWSSVRARLEGKRIFPRLNLIRLGSLDPRRQVYFFYLAMVRRGGEQLVLREPSQSPSEYAVTLAKALPPVDEEIHSITESFIEARYSRQTISLQKANIVKTAWEQIRRALQTKSKH